MWSAYQTPQPSASADFPQQHQTAAAFNQPTTATFPHQQHPTQYQFAVPPHHRDGCGNGGGQPFHPAAFSNPTSTGNLQYVALPVASASFQAQNTPTAGGYQQQQQHPSYVYAPSNVDGAVSHQSSHLPPQSHHHLHHQQPAAVGYFPSPLISQPQQQQQLITFIPMMPSTTTQPNHNNHFAVPSSLFPPPPQQQVVPMVYQDVRSAESSFLASQASPSSQLLQPSAATPGGGAGQQQQMVITPAMVMSTPFGPRRPEGHHHTAVAAPFMPSGVVAPPPAYEGKPPFASTTGARLAHLPTPTAEDVASGRTFIAELRRERVDAIVASRLSSAAIPQINGVRGVLESEPELVWQLCENERGKIVCSVVERCGAVNCSHMLNVVLQNFSQLAFSQRGCIALPRIIAALRPQDLDPFARIIISELPRLICDRYANYVCKQIANSGRNDIVERMCTVLSEQPDVVSRIMIDKFGSFVVDELLKRGSFPAAQKLIDRMFFFSPQELRLLCRDQYGNYVVQSALDNMHRGNVDVQRYVAATVEESVSSPYFNKIAEHFA